MTRSERRAARIAVDLLGGDNAPAVVVDGALLALDADPVLRLLPVGPQTVLDDLAARLPAAQRARVEPAPVETDGTLPVHAAVRLVSTGRADAVLSAGATGSAVRSAVAHCGRYPDLRRPALAVTVPAATGPLILLDVGAAPDPTPTDLVRHAVLGAGYAAATLQRARPRVGLLSIGTEPGVGDELRRAVDRLLTGGALPPDAEYVGLVEGHDVPAGGAADVIVTDGFTGNVLLKGVEGALRLAGKAAGAALLGGDRVPRAAALLGVAAPVVVCHGAAHPSDIASGIEFAARMATGHTTDRVAQMDRVFREMARAPGGVRGDEAAAGPVEGDRGSR